MRVTAARARRRMVTGTEASLRHLLPRYSVGFSKAMLQRAAIGRSWRGVAYGWPGHAGLSGTPAMVHHPVTRGFRSVGESNRQRHLRSMQKDGAMRGELPPEMDFRIDSELDGKLAADPVIAEVNALGIRGVIPEFIECSEGRSCGETP